MLAHLSLLWVVLLFFFFKQKTAYEMRISDWSSDVCSSDLSSRLGAQATACGRWRGAGDVQCGNGNSSDTGGGDRGARTPQGRYQEPVPTILCLSAGRCWHVARRRDGDALRSEEHTSELQSLMRISYDVFCLKKKKRTIQLNSMP